MVLHNLHKTLPTFWLSPFSNWNNDEFIHTINGKKIKFTHVTKENLAAEPGFFQQINSNLDTNLSKDYLRSKFKQIKIDVKINLNFFHFNISSLPYHFPELYILLETSKIQFGIIDITESRLNKSHLTNIKLPNYNIKNWLTDGPNVGNLLYIKVDIIYKRRNDLKILKSKMLQSIFNEIINLRTKNFIVGSIYCDPRMERPNLIMTFSSIYAMSYSVKKTKT